MADWRLQGQERYLAGVTLIRATYLRPRKDWDHDHCEFCWREFSLRTEGLHEGYATADHYRWVCAQCFEDFREQFRWVLSAPSGTA